MITIFRSHELDETGVTPVWRWECTRHACNGIKTNAGNSLFWETALRMGLLHVKWHEKVFYSKAVEEN